MGFKETYNTLRPGTWVKASLAAVIAVFLERTDIGVGRFNQALIFAPIIAFLMAGSAGLLILDAQGPTAGGGQDKSKKQRLIWAAVGFFPLVIAWILAIIISVLANLGLKVAIWLAVETIVFAAYSFFQPSGRATVEITAGLRSFSMAAGLLSGALFLTQFPSVFTLLLFVGLFLLQMTKDLLKATVREETDQADFQMGKGRLIYSEIATLVALTALLIVEFLPILNPFLYLWSWALAGLLMLISIALLLMTHTLKALKAVNGLLKAAIAVVFLAAFLGTF